MKANFYKGLIGLFICFCSFESNATIVLVNVEDFEFNPGDFTVNVGDTVRWMWDNSAGPHTTTSTTIPVGAAAWNQAINSGSQVYSYTPTVAGSYSYRCTIHAGMNGHFNVQGPIGLNELDPIMTVLITGTDPSTKEIQLTCYLPQSTFLTIRVCDLSGVIVYAVEAGIQNEGVYAKTFNVQNQHTGIYYVTVETQDGIFKRAVYIE